MRLSNMADDGEDCCLVHFSSSNLNTSKLSKLSIHQLSTILTRSRQWLETEKFPERGIAREVLNNNNITENNIRDDNIVDNNNNDDGDGSNENNNNNIINNNALTSTTANATATTTRSDTAHHSFYAHQSCYLRFISLSKLERAKKSPKKRKVSSSS